VALNNYSINTIIFIAICFTQMNKTMIKPCISILYIRLNWKITFRLWFMSSSMIIVDAWIASFYRTFYRAVTYRHQSHNLITHLLWRESSPSPTSASHGLVTGFHTICNGPKQTISARVGLGCYKWYPSQTPGGVLARTLGPQGSELWDPTLVGEGNETFLIRVWKPLPNRRIWKPWGWRRYISSQSWQYLLVWAWVVIL